MKKIGVLISGGGTNLQALIDKQGTVLKSGKIVCVCSNNSKAYGLERAKNAGIATKVIRKNADCRGDNDEFNRQICAYMKEMDVDVIVLAGFLAILGGDLLKEYANKIVNIHPCSRMGSVGQREHFFPVRSTVRFPGCAAAAGMFRQAEPCRAGAC